MVTAHRTRVGKNKNNYLFGDPFVETTPPSRDRGGREGGGSIFIEGVTPNNNFYRIFLLGGPLIQKKAKNIKFVVVQPTNSEIYNIHLSRIPEHLYAQDET